MRAPRLLIGFFLSSAAIAGAQGEERVSVFAGGGISVPTAPDALRDNWGESYDVGLGMGLRINPNLFFQGAFAYDRFAFDEEGSFPAAGLDIKGAAAEILSFSGELRVRFIGDSDRVSPYVLGGAGVARVATGDITLSPSTPDLPLTPYDLFTNPRYFDPRFYGIEITIEGFSETKAMTAFGGGIDIPVAETVQAFLEARFQITFTSDDSTNHATIRGGVRFAF